MQDGSPTDPGAETRGWLIVADPKLEPPLALVESLADAGLTLMESSARSGPGIICFQRLTDSVCAQVSELSRNRTEPVIALALEQRPEIRAAWQLLEAGAADVMTWDHSPATAQALAARFQRCQEIETLVRSPLVRNNLIGDSSAWTSILRSVVEVASFTRVPVLLLGESGAGKELVARLIHSLSPPPEGTTKGELVTLDCAAVPETLSSTTFFGHSKGAFTGAVAAREGVFAQADGGTLLLDEVGELSLALQAELMRAVQEGLYRPVGSDRERAIRFRLVSATNCDIEEGGNQTFRRDFFFRIAGWRCRLPPLRDRRQDIPALVEHFLREHLPDRDPPAVDPAVETFLKARDYPGNVRELRHLAARIALHHVGPGPITIGDLPPEEWLSGELRVVGWPDMEFARCIERALDCGAKLREITDAAAETAIRVAVDQEEGSTQRASDRLGVTPRTIQLRRAARKRASERRAAPPGEPQGSA